MGVHDGNGIKHEGDVLIVIDTGYLSNYSRTYSVMGFSATFSVNNFLFNISKIRRVLIFFFKSQDYFHI